MKYKTDKTKIESTLFENCLPVNQIAVLNRMIEILKSESVNSNDFLTDKNRYNYECCLYLLVMLTIGNQIGTIDMHDWWLQLNDGIVSNK